MKETVLYLGGTKKTIQLSKIHIKVDERVYESIMVKMIKWRSFLSTEKTMLKHFKGEDHYYNNSNNIKIV